MQRKLLGILAFAATAGAVGAASAADIYTPPPAVVPIYTPVSVYNWSGFYVGVNGGWGWGQQTADTGAAFSGPISGGILGAHAGYNFMFANNIVAGVEADVAWSGQNGTVTPGPTVTQSLGWYSTFRGRVGYAFNNVLPYVTGGFAIGGGTRTTSIGGGLSDSQTHTGYVLGAGVEWAFAQNWTAKLEYQYVNLGAKTYNITATPSVGLTDNIVKVGIAYKF